MKISTKFMLACEGVMTRKMRTFMLGLGVSVGTAALIFLVSLIFGAKTYVDKKVGAIRENMLNVYKKSPPPANPNPLTEEAIAQLYRGAGEKELDVRIYGIRPVDPRPAIKIKDIEEPFKVPKIVGMNEALFGDKSLKHIPEFTYRHVKPVDVTEAFSEPDETDTEEKNDNFIPVIASNMFIEAVKTIAGGDPQIFELFRDLIEGREPFYIVLDDNTAYRCKVVSQDNIVESFSLAVPIRYAEEWNEKQKVNGGKPDFSYLIIVVKDIKNLGQSKEVAAAAGYRPEPTEAQKLLNAVNRGATYLFIIAIIFCLVIALVAAIGIFNGLSISVMEQAPRIGLLRSVGATRGNIVFIYLIEALIIGIVGGVIGLVAVHLLMWGSDIALKDFLANVTNIRDIDTLFAWQFSVAAFIRIGAVGLSLVTGILAGVAPAYRASRLNPAVVLREG
jgi:hypothetical protein